MMFGLEENTLNKIKDLFTKIPEINKVLIYGSRAKGNFKLGSDIDLVFVNSSIDFTLMNKIKNELDDLNLPYTFDLCVFEKIESKELIEHINRVGQIFYLKK